MIVSLKRDFLIRYANCTLLAAQLEKEGQEGVIQSCVDFLESSEFIRLQEVDGAVRYVATRLGLACLAASLGPDESLKVFTELSKARKQFVLENELHIIYLIVPIYAAVSWPNMDWMSYLSLWEELSEDMKRVGTIVGVEERWMVRAMRGTLRLADPQQRHCLGVHQRFYTALALHDLVHEVSLADVAVKFGATKGMLQGLQQAASTFAGMVTVFCQRLGWNNLELLVGQFQDRLEFGIQRELTDLCRLASVDGARARMLFDSGVESVALLAAAKAEDVENIILANTAFASNKEGLRSSKGVFITGRPAMTVEQCSKLMVGEARALLQRDLGLKPQAWDSQPVSKATRATPSPSSRPRKRRRSSQKMSEPAAPSPHLAFQLQTPIQNLTTALQRKAVSPTAELTVANPKPKSPLLPLEIKVPSISLEDSQELPAQCPRLDLEEVALTKTNDDGQIKIESGDDKNPLICETGAEVGNQQGLNDKDNVALRHQCLQRVKEQNKSALKTNQEVSKEKNLTNVKLSKVSGTSVVNTSFDMSSVVENIFEESMVLDEDEHCCPTGLPPSVKKRVSWGDCKDEGLLVIDIPKLDENISSSQPMMFDTTDEEGWTTNAIVIENLAKDVASAATPKVTSMPATPRIAVCSEELSLHWSDSGGEGGDDAFTGEDNNVLETTSNQNMNLDVNMVTMETMSASLLDHAMEEEVVVQNALKLLPARRDETVSGDNLDKSGPRKRTSSKTRRESASKSQVQRRDRRRRAGRVGKRSRRRQISKSPGAIMSDSEDDSDRDGNPEVKASFCPKQVLVKAEEEKKKQEPIEPEPIRNTEQPSQSLSQLSELCVIDVNSSKQLLDSFAGEWRKCKSFSLAVAVERSSETSSNPILDVSNGRVVGIAVSWSAFDVYYIGLTSSQQIIDDTLCPASQDKDIKLDEMLDLIGEMIESDACITAVAWRQQMGLLYSLTGKFPGGSAKDPAVAGWLLDPGSSPATLARLAVDHCPALLQLLPTLGSGPGSGSLALNPAANQPARHRAAAEAVLVRHLMGALEQALERAQLMQHFLRVEMGSEVILGWMELTGMGVNEAEFEDCRLLLQARLKIIEDKAFKEAGRYFTFSSPQDICKLLYHELRLPVNGDPKLTLKMVRPGKQGLKLSASKEILEKLVARGHSLPGLVLEHRRITAAINTTVTPLLQGAVSHPLLGGVRLYPTAVTHTATGRVSLHEPNLQNVPRDFQLALTEELKAAALGRRAGRRRGRNSSCLALSPLERLLGPPDTSSATVSLRHAIVPAEGNLFLSADYKQIELRLLAHLSKDPSLCRALSGEEDVFKSIAGQLNNCLGSEISEDQRREAKQTVYGIIYGMGDRALASQLGVEQEEGSR